MKLSVALALSGALIVMTSSVKAQVVAPAATPPAPIAAPTGGAFLRTGTPVALKMAEVVTTKGKKLRVGYRMRLEIAEPVLVNGVVVIPAGSPAIGEVTDVRNKGMWGKSGRINAQLLYVTVNGRQVRLSGQFDDKGTTGTAGVIGSVALVPIAGFFVTGTSAELPLGGAVKGFIDEDVPLNIAMAEPTPMNVQAPAAVPAVVTTPATNVAPMTQTISTPPK